MVVRIPEFGSGDFRLGSQVIVRESQRAVFYRDGKSLDLFDPGRHTITTANLPILSGMLRLVTGGNNIFTAEVYFVNMREYTDLKWGTPQPISLRDTDLGLVRLRAFGQYTMQMADPKRFVDRDCGYAGHLHDGPDRGLSARRYHQPHDGCARREHEDIFDLPQLYDEIGAACAPGCRMTSSPWALP